MKERIGRRFESNSTGWFEVVSLGGRNKWGKQLYKIRFDHAGFETEVKWSNIRKKAVKNPFYPSVLGVGYIGHGDSRHPFYTRWASMLHRCYNPECPQYQDYGGRGIKVSHVLHNFNNYRALLEALPGYGDPALTTIDRIDNDDDYKPGNLKWANMKQQTANRRRFSNQRDFIAIAPDGKGLTGFNQSEFAREHGLISSCISACLNNKAKSHKGWTFQYR